MRYLRPSRLRRVGKWFGLLACLCILCTFVFSMRRAVYWDSPNVDHSAGLYVGHIDWSWRPVGYDAATDRHRPSPGWGIARYAGGNPVLNEWWPRIAVNRAWRGVIVPLWIPFVLLAVPTTLLWYRDRRSVSEALERWKRRLCPKTKRRVTLALVALFGLAQALALIVGFWIVPALCSFFFDYGSRGYDLCYQAWDIAMPLLFLTAPAWGLLWSLLWVGLRNHLFQTLMVGYCPACGYDLRSSTGECPECGTKIEADRRIKSSQPADPPAIVED